MSRVSEAVAAAKADRERIRCKTCKFMASLDKDERIDLEKVIASPMPSRVVADVMNRLGCEITCGAVMNHRDNHVPR